MTLDQAIKLAIRALEYEHRRHEDTARVERRGLLASSEATAQSARLQAAIDVLKRELPS